MFNIDQESQGLGLARNFFVESEASVGQEFIPTELSLNAVDVAVVAANPRPGLGQVRIREDTITGTILASSAPVWLYGSLITYVRFTFGPDVPVQPGQRYVIELVPMGHTLATHARFADVGDSYPNGRMITDGVPDETIVGGGRMSLEFAEGVDTAVVWPPRVTFEASNEVPIHHKVTLLALNGFGFPGYSQVMLSIHQSDASGPVLSHEAVTVAADGTLRWHQSVSPQQDCDSQLVAVLSVGSGVIAATATVLCPPPP